MKEERSSLQRQDDRRTAWITCYSPRREDDLQWCCPNQQRLNLVIVFTFFLFILTLDELHWEIYSFKIIQHIVPSGDIFERFLFYLADYNHKMVSYYSLCAVPLNDPNIFRNDSSHLQHMSNITLTPAKSWNLRYWGFVSHRLRSYHTIFSSYCMSRHCWSLLMSANHGFDVYYVRDSWPVQSSANGLLLLIQLITFSNNIVLSAFARISGIGIMTPEPSIFCIDRGRKRTQSKKIEAIMDDQTILLQEFCQSDGIVLLRILWINFLRADNYSYLTYHDRTDQRNVPIWHRDFAEHQQHDKPVDLIISYLTIPFPPRITL